MLVRKNLEKERERELERDGEGERDKKRQRESIVGGGKRLYYVCA